MSNDEAAAALDGASSSPRRLHPEDVSGGASATVAMVLAETQAIPSGVLSEFSGWSNHARCACQLSRPCISSIAAARCNVCKPLITVCKALISELLATAILAVEIQFLAAIRQINYSPRVFTTAVCCLPWLCSISQAFHPRFASGATADCRQEVVTTSLDVNRHAAFAIPPYLAACSRLHHACVHVPSKPSFGGSFVALGGDPGSTSAASASL